MSKFKVTDEFRAPQGVYKVRFGGFTTREDDGTPVAKATDFGLRVYANFVICQGDLEGEEIPCGMDLDEGLPSWCFLFSGVMPQSTELSEIEDQMKTEKVLPGRVNDSGWAQGVFVPKGTYLARFVRFAKRDENTGKPVIVMKEFNNELRPMVYWQFEIAAGDLTGVRVPGSCRYAIRSRGGDELELPSRSSMYNWFLACGVDFDSLPDFADPDNVLPEMEELMQKLGVVLSVQVGDNGWVSGGQSAISPAPAGVTVVKNEPPAKKKQVKPEDQAKPEAKESGNGLQSLLNLIGAKAKEFGYGEGVAGGQLTQEGKKFASDYVAPACAERGIPRAFGKMSVDQMRELAEYLQTLKTEEEEF